VRMRHRKKELPQSELMPLENIGKNVLKLYS
jgi:hypothetical protein